MKIVTLQDANLATCCGCPWPLCFPRKECQSFNGFADDTAYRNLSDGTWKRYLKRIRTVTRVGTETDDAGDIRTVWTFDAHWSHADTYDFAFTGRAKCEDLTPALTPYCEAGGYETFVQTQISTGDPITSQTSTISSVPGEPAGSCLFRILYDNGVDPPYYVTYSDTDILLTGIFNAGPVPVVDVTTYDMALTYADYKAAVRTKFNSYDFPNEDCDLGLCSSYFIITDEPASTDTAVHAYFGKARYRFGVPENYSTPDLPRSTWEMTWDEVYASDAWWAWYDGGMHGAAPDASLALVAALDWTWDGDMTGDHQWSPWHVIDVPEDPGEVRPVNVMSVCWKSTRIGYKPTAYGDQVALPS